MKYFTKEWYTDLLISEMCFQLRKTAKAATCSDAFFEKLYKVEEKAYMRYCKRMARACKLPFDVEANHAEFKSNYNDNLKFIKANMPEDILTEIADVRVFALGSVTDDMAQKITRYCGKKNRLCESVQRRYDNDSEPVDEMLGAKTTKALSEIYNSQILSITKEINATVISVADDESESPIRLKLENAALTASDGELEESIIIKYELLPISDGDYEFSLLTMDKDSKLLTATYTTTHISVE